MDKINRGVQRLFAFGAGLSMALVFAIIFVNALRRYTLGKSIAWGEELPIYLTIYGVMFGVAYAYMTDSHIRFSVISDLLSTKVRRALDVVSDLVVLASGVALAYAGHAFAMRRGHLDSSGLKSAGDWLAESTGIAVLEWVGKVGTWQYAIAIGGALFAVAAAVRLAARLRTFKGAN